MLRWLTTMSVQHLLTCRHSNSISLVRTFCFIFLGDRAQHTFSMLHEAFHHKSGFLLPSQAPSACWPCPALIQTLEVSLFFFKKKKAKKIKIKKSPSCEASSWPLFQRCRPASTASHTTEGASFLMEQDNPSMPLKP